MEEKKTHMKFSNLDRKKKTGIILGIVFVIYLLISLFFQYHYFMGTEINGYSCGFHSVKKVKEIIRGSVKDYQIVIKEREEKEETMTSDQIGLTFVDDGKLESIKKEQKGYAWITALFRSYEYSDGITLEVDENAYEDTVNSLNAFNKDMVVAPKDAYSSYDKEKNSYVIIDEIYGNTIKRDLFLEKLRGVILEQKPEMDVEAMECYENPVYKKDSKEILTSNDTLNKYVSTDITYDFDDRTEELTGQKIHNWIYVTKKFKVKIKKEKVENYISNLANKYDTVGVERNFTSIAGNDVTVEGGTYGWKIDQEAEVSKLIKLIKKGKQGKREPEYEHIAKSRKKQDLGDTYVEVDLGSQHMWFYKDGKILVSTPVVTGDTTKGRGTPTGVYYILYKTTDYTLTGQGYESHVDYWLPFTQMGVGIHDSSWRNGYGGGIYAGDGSHGCVNTPKEAVRTIYNNIESTYPVVVHW